MLNRLKENKQGGSISANSLKQATKNACHWPMAEPQLGLSWPEDGFQETSMRIVHFCYSLR